MTAAWEDEARRGSAAASLACPPLNSYHGHMKMVKVADAKNNLSRHLAFVRRGGRIRILDRDTPVADLVPVETTGIGDEDDRLLAALERQGVLRRGVSAPLPRELLEPGPPDPSGGVRGALLDERRRSR